MTGSTHSDVFVICGKCTGLLPAQDESSTQEHLASCNGDIAASQCEKFALDKTMLLQLLVSDETTELSSMDASAVESQNTPKEGAKKRGRPKRKRKDSDDFVPVAIKHEKIEDEKIDDTGCVRRSKRTPKPKKKYSPIEHDEKKSEDHTDINIMPQMSVSLNDGAINSSVEHDPAIGPPGMECDAVEDITSAAIEAIIMSHAKTEPEMSVEGDKEFVPTKTEPVDNENAESKLKYFEWKQKLAEEYVQYKEEITDEEGNLKEVYRCPKCTTKTFTANRVGMFGRHFRTCKPSGSDELICPEPDCTFVAKDAKRFSEHKRSHLLPYMCEFCPRRFADKRNMIEHRMTHTDERPYACESCDYRTRNKRLLKEHKRKHTGNFLHCTESGCGFFTPYKGSLASHIELRHRPQTKHECPQCQYVTNSQANIKRHMSSHEEGGGAAQQTRLFQCSLCSYKALTKFAVVSHLRSHTKEKLYFCNKCDYSASYASAFRQHMMTHLGLKTWQCGPCGYNSNTRAKVHRHLQNKHPDVDIASSVVNLGISLKLDLSKFRRGGGQKYITEEVVVAPEVDNVYVEQQVTEQTVEVAGEEEILSEEVIGDGTHELIVMTEDGNIIIPSATDLNGLTVHEVPFEEAVEGDNVIHLDVH